MRIAKSVVISLFILVFAVYAASAAEESPTTGSAGASSEGSAINITTHGDAERVAQVWGGVAVDYYVLQSSFQRAPGVWVNGGMEMRRVNGIFKITYLQVNGNVITNALDAKRHDKPLNVFPKNILGETRYFSMWLSAIDSHGIFIASGNFYTEFLNSGDPIKINLEPAQIRKDVSFSVPSGVDPENLRLSIQVDGQKRYYQYDAYLKGFQVFIDPVKVTDYEVKDISTGITYERGTIDALSVNPVAVEEGSVINFVYEENMIDLSFTADQHNFSLEHQKLDGHVMRPCAPPAQTGCMEERSAKVYLIHLDRTHNFYTNLSGPDNDKFKIEVRKWVGKGSMPLLAESKSGAYYPYVVLDNGYDTLVVTILAADSHDKGVTSPKDFNMYIAQF